MKKNCKLLTILMMAVFALTGCDQNPEEEVVLKGITLDTTNVKTEFTVGDEFTTDGLIVTAAYSDETTKTVDGWTATGNDLSKPEESQEITITYAEDEVEVSASYTIVVKAKEPEKEPPATPKIALSFNTKIESYSLVKIFDVIYLSDKSNANYKDYSVCKANEISDSVLQLKVNDYDESYALTINDKAVTVTEGKVAFQDILKNTIVGKNTIKITKDNETIDSAEYTVETGYFDCPSPALKIVTKEGSSAEVGESHIIKAGENLRYGVKAGTSSKIEFEVVQEDGKSYPAEIKTSFKVENATVDNKLVTINGKNKNTYEVKISVDVPEENKKSGTAYSGTASFTTKYDVDTGFVKSEGSAYNYKLSYSLDGKDYTEFSTASDTPSMYCFDEFGNVYFTYEDKQNGYKKSVKKYSPETKETTEILSPNSCNNIRTISYDFDTSTLYVIYNDNFFTKCGETENTYDLYVYNDEVEGTSAELKKIVVKEGNAYIWYSYYDNNFNTLYKFTMNISGETIKLENKQSYHFPENVQSKNSKNKYNVNVNEMVLIDDDIYMAVGIGKESYEYPCHYEYKESEFESRGCVLKFDTLENKYNVLGLSEESKTVKTKNWYGYYDDSNPENPMPGWTNFKISSNENLSGYYPLYTDEALTTRVITKFDIPLCMPNEKDSKSFGYITGFAAIKPKKLVCTQNRHFVYVDDDVDTIKMAKAFSSVDLCDFAISDFTKVGTESEWKLNFTSCFNLTLYNEDKDLWYEKDSQKYSVKADSFIF